MDAKKVVFDKALLKNSMFSEIDFLNMPFLKEENCFVYGVMDKGTMTSGGIFCVNRDHIYICYIVGDFLKYGAIHDGLMIGICKALNLGFIAIDAGRRGVEKVLKSLYNFSKNEHGELIKYVAQ